MFDVMDFYHLQKSVKKKNILNTGLDAVKTVSKKSDCSN